MKYFLAAIFSLFLASCQYDLEVARKQNDRFIILKDQHRSVNPFRGFKGTGLSFEARFDETAKYMTKSADNQADINKLLGFSDCGNDHHTNSARLGWRWYNDRLEILAYVYNKGQRITEYITSVPLDEFVSYEISKTSQGYRFKVSDKVVNIPADFKDCTGGANYYLWPYFGGDETAPQNILIVIQVLIEHTTTI